MNQKYFLFLLYTVFSLLLVLFAFSSWKFLLESVERTREIKTEVLQLPSIDIERYNDIVKKGI